MTLQSWTLCCQNLWLLRSEAMMQPRDHLVRRVHEDRGHRDEALLDPLITAHNLSLFPHQDQVITLTTLNIALNITLYITLITPIQVPLLRSRSRNHSATISG